jgi:hypothetical protein
MITSETAGGHLTPGGGALDGQHLKSGLVEMSADGMSWREIARKENNQQLNGS